MKKEKIKEDELLKTILSEWKKTVEVLETHLLKLKPIFPFHSPTDDRTLDHLALSCTICKNLLLDLRGEISEKFGTIESDLFGFCLNCYRDEHHILRWHKEGNWSCKVDGDWHNIKMTIQTPSKLKKLFNNIFKKEKSED